MFKYIDNLSRSLMELGYSATEIIAILKEDENVNQEILESWMEGMDYCHVCDEPKDNLSKCEGCNQDVCPDCCVEITAQNIIDFNLCKTCEELSGLS